MNTIRFNKCAVKSSLYEYDQIQQVRGQTGTVRPRSVLALGTVFAKRGVRQEMIAASIDDRDDNDDDQKHNAFNGDVCLGGSVGVDV